MMTTRDRTPPGQHSLVYVVTVNKTAQVSGLVALNLPTTKKKSRNLDSRQIVGLSSPISERKNC